MHQSDGVLGSEADGADSQRPRSAETHFGHLPFKDAVPNDDQTYGPRRARSIHARFGVDSLPGPVPHANRTRVESRNRKGNSRLWFSDIGGIGFAPPRFRSL